MLVNIVLWCDYGMNVDVNSHLKAWEILKSGMYLKVLNLGWCYGMAMLWKIKVWVNDH